MEKLTVSPRQAARSLGHSLNYVYTLIWSGKLKAKQVNRRWVVDPTAVQERLRLRDGEARSDYSRTEEPRDGA